jgi:hypothetical protein
MGGIMPRFRLYRVIRFDGLAALRAWVLLTGFLGVNALALVLILGRVPGRAANVLAVVVLLIIAVTCLLIVFSERARFFFINPASADLYESEPFMFLGGLTLLLGIGAAFAAL